MRQLLKTALVFFLLSATGCEAADSGAGQQPSANTVSGTLNLFLHRRDATGAYVRFKLTEYAEDGTVNLIAQSGFIPVTESPLPFSLAYPPGSVKPQNTYRLITTVTEDPEGNKEIATMSSAVLTHGQLSVIHIVINQAPEPIE